MVESITQPNEPLTYTYDNMGRISTVTRNGLLTQYQYDLMGQLTRVNDQEAGFTWLYTYDTGGNILSKQRYAYTTSTPTSTPTTTTYGYDTQWKDKLTSYNGTPISYNASGGVINYGAWAFNWGGTGQIASMLKNGVSYNMLYGVNGLLSSMTVGGTQLKYTWRGSSLTHLRYGNDELHFFYGGSRNPVQFTLNGTVYFYEYNLQGDVIHILDQNGNGVVKYTYDAWGKPIAATGDANLAKLNPFRYRGYVYNDDLELYYLQSRFYYPEWGRFLNPDSQLGCIGAFLEHNLFAYCNNDAVNRIDPTGKVIDEYWGIPEEFSPAALGGLASSAGTESEFNGARGSGYTIEESLPRPVELTPQPLMEELANSGVKFTPEDVVAVTKTPEGKLVWLETGKSGLRGSGLNHIIEVHSADFANKGISTGQIPEFLIDAISQGNIIDYQGVGTDRPIYQVDFYGQTIGVAITTGSNGYIVGANPVSLP